jgi:hypothetical protein
MTESARMTLEALLLEAREAVSSLQARVSELLLLEPQVCVGAWKCGSVGVGVEAREAVSSLQSRVSELMLLEPQVCVGVWECGSVEVWVWVWVWRRGRQ